MSCAFIFESLLLVTMIWGHILKTWTCDANTLISFSKGSIALVIYSYDTVQPVTDASYMHMPAARTEFWCMSPAQMRHLDDDCNQLH